MNPFETMFGITKIIVSEDWTYIRSYNRGYDYYLSPRSSLCLYIMDLKNNSFYIQAGATGAMPN